MGALSSRSPYPLHRDVGVEGHIATQCVGTPLCDLRVSLLVHRGLFTFHVFVQSPCPQTSVLAPPMSSMVLSLQSPGLGLFCRCWKDPDHLKWSAHTPSQSHHLFPQTLQGVLPSYPGPPLVWRRTSLPFLRWGQPDA